MEARVERVWNPRVDEEPAGEAAGGPGGGEHGVGGHGVGGHSVGGHSVGGHSVNGHSVNGHSVGELNAWLIGDDEEVIVIDPGEDAAAVLELAADREILAVICTHGHVSHVAAALEVAERDDAPAALHPADRVLWRMAHKGAGDPEIEMEDGGRFDVADVQLEVIRTPGHTPGSVSLYCADLGVVFTGDTLAAGGPVAHGGVFADFPGQLTAIGERLLDLPPRTRVLPGHGEETTIGDAVKLFDDWVTAGPSGALD